MDWSAGESGRNRFLHLRRSIEILGKCCSLQAQENLALPNKAGTDPSKRCSCCGEPAMESKLQMKGDITMEGKHKHTHSHEHEHAHEHDHEHEHDGTKHAHKHEHTHAHEHTHEHEHDHVHTGASDVHNHEHTEDHGPHEHKHPDHAKEPHGHKH